MRIEYRQGDLFKTEIKHIVHGCNARGVMGKGVALQVKTQFPRAYEEYVQWIKRNGVGILGTVQFVDCGAKTIINAITQRDYAKSVNDSTRYVSYDAVAQCMAEINSQIPGKQLALPRIGAQLGGGRWEILERIIETELTEVQPVVYSL